MNNLESFSWRSLRDIGPTPLGITLSTAFPPLLGSHFLLLLDETMGARRVIVAKGHFIYFLLNTHVGSSINMSQNFSDPVSLNEVQKWVFTVSEKV